MSVDDEHEKRRMAGAGSVDELPSGRWRARITKADGKRYSIGVYATEREATGVLNAALARLAEGPEAATGARTLRTFGTHWMAERELSGDVRAIRSDKSRWRNHIATAPFFDWPLTKISPLNIADWVEVLRKKRVGTRFKSARGPNKKISRKTVKEILLLLKICFDAALAPHRLVRENPAIGIKVKKELRTHNPWTFLLLEEQTKLFTSPAIPESDRLMMAFAVGTGMRLGEQFNLELADLRVEGDAPEVIVRYGSKGKPPKNGKIRHVPLFGLALAAARRWLEVLPSYAKENRERVVFPGPRGGRRCAGKTFQASRKVVAKDGTSSTKKIDVFHAHLAAAARWSAGALA